MQLKGADGGEEKLLPHLNTSHMTCICNGAQPCNSNSPRFKTPPLVITILLTLAAIFSKPPVKARESEPSVIPHTLWVSSTDFLSTTDWNTGGE